MNPVIRNIICTNYLEMNLEKYKSQVQMVENSEWIKILESKGFLEKKYFPFNHDRSNTLGQFTLDGFQFSCSEFAIYYTLCITSESYIKKLNEIGKLPDTFYKKSSEVSLSKIVFLINHINDRNKISHRLIHILEKKQQRFLQSLNPLDLRPVPYSDLLKEYNKLYPSQFCDFSIISRVFKQKKVIFSDGVEHSLKELLPNKSFLIGVKIDHVINQKTTNLSDGKIKCELLKQYGLSLSTRYIAYCRNRIGIPSARYRNNKLLNLKFPLSPFFRWNKNRFNRFPINLEYMNCQYQEKSCLI